MSTINKLSIRGIRSFGTQKEDEQKIVFTSPLTLLVGENGCGKTTVIECLKYALTGDMPPGSDKGKTFIHDPKVFRNTSSLGQVKLVITDTFGKQKQCIRSMKTEIQKSGKTKFETLDSTIITENPLTGKNEEVGRRIDEVNAEMASAMGVSKAILNNVIFCHQEDSNWPLDEGKKLKEKFDAIFGTTEYNKAIEKIIKLYKDYKGQLTTCVVEKGYMEQTKRDADRKLLDLDLLNQKQETMNLKLSDFDKELAPIEEQMLKLLKKEKECSEFYGKKAKLESSISNCKINAEKTRNRIKTLLDLGVDQLDQQLQSFKINQAENARKLQALNIEHTKLIADEKKQRESLAKEKASLEKMTDQAAKKMELTESRVKAIKNLGELMNILIDVNMESQFISEDDLGTALHRIQRGIDDKEENLRNLKSMEEKKDLELQQKIDEVRKEKTAMETNITAQQESVKKLVTDRKKLSQEISSIESSMPTFIKLVQEIKKVEDSLAKVKSENDIEELEEERMVIETDKNELEKQAEALETDVTALESISKVTSELEMKQRDLTKDQNEFDRTKNKQASTLKSLFPAKAVDRNYKNVLQTLSDELQREVRATKNSIDDSKMKGNRLQTERDHLRKQQQQKETELKGINETIYKICDGRAYLDVLASQKEKVDKLNMELAFHKSSESTLQHYISEIKQDKCCPLCHKDLESNETDDLNDEISNKIRQLPDQIKDTEKKLKAESQKFYKLNEAKSSYDNISKLETEVKQLGDDFKRLEDDYQKNILDNEDLEMQIVEPESKLKLITPTMLSDMCRLDELLKSVTLKAKEVADLRSKLPDAMPEKSLDVAKADLRVLNNQVKAKSDFMNKLSQKIHAAQTKINGLQSQLNGMVTKKVEQQEKVQGLERMKEQLKEMVNEVESLANKIESEQEKLPPIDKKLESLNEAKKHAKVAAAKNFDTLQVSINNIKLKQGELENLNDEINSYEAMELEKKIVYIEKTMKDSKTRISDLEKNISLKLADIQRLSEEVTNQEGNQRNLEDNLELCQIQLEQKEAESSYESLRKEMGDMNPSRLMAEKKELREKREKISDNRQLLKGQMSGLQNQIKSKEDETNEPRYKNAKANYLKECYKENVLKTMLADMSKYRSALEKSLLKFHADKMKEINHTIRELWTRIYRGNDIDYIMIKTDEDDAKAVGSDKKRSYNYRVVQAKNGGAEIDMRGRCSAGQKVLASLIIRMALADTFSANCGILALDEPTTNLDSNNVQALCLALGQIIDEREKSGRFMLVIITHDEHFITAMERVERYYKLTRDSMGRSRIDTIET